MNKCLECGKDAKNKFCSKSCQNSYYWKKPEYREKMSLMFSKSNTGRAPANKGQLPKILETIILFGPKKTCFKFS